MWRSLLVVSLSRATVISRPPTGLPSRSSSHHSVTENLMVFRMYTHGEIASESIFILTDTFNMCHPSYESMSSLPGSSLPTQHKKPYPESVATATPTRLAPPPAPPPHAA